MASGLRIVRRMILNSATGPTPEILSVQEFSYLFPCVISCTAFLAEDRQTVVPRVQPMPNTLVV